MDQELYTRAWRASGQPMEELHSNNIKKKNKNYNSSF